MQTFILIATVHGCEPWNICVVQGVSLDEVATKLGGTFLPHGTGSYGTFTPGVETAQKISSFLKGLRLRPDDVDCLRLETVGCIS